MAVRSVTGSLRAALSDTVAELDLGSQDGAVVALALRYAEAIDEDDEALAHLGPKFLAALIELKATPKSRSAKSTPSGPKAMSELERLRAARSS